MSTTVAAEVVRIEDDHGQPLMTMIEPAGNQGRTRITWVCTGEVRAIVDPGASFEEILLLEEQLSEIGYTYAERDEFGDPIPDAEMDGIIVYYLVKKPKS